MHYNCETQKKQNQYLKQYLIYSLISYSLKIKTIKKWMQQEPSIKDALEFVTEIKNLSKIDVTAIKGQEIVLIMGPTGSGKSTFLNMMAGSKFTSIKNNKGHWQITAHPCVATVGHAALSQTFLPNYWKDQASNIFYCDCPGFNDTRGYVHDISKSYFLKQIASYAKSLKIVAIFEISILYAERGSGVGKSIKQIKGLIENFNFKTDCIVVVNKCDSQFQPLNAANIFEEIQSNYTIPEERIFLITKPDKQGNLICLDNSIIGKAPSFKQQCHIPLSEENKLKIQQRISTLDKQIRSKTKKLEQLIELSDLDFYQNNLKATQGQIEHFENLLDSSKKEFKNCDSMKELVDKIYDFCNHLLAKNCSSLSNLIKQSFNYIREINEGRIFLLSLIENEPNIEVLTETFKFSAVARKKRGQNVGFENYQRLVSYLKSENIEINDLFTSVHNKLTANPPSITVSYSGVTDYEESTDYSGYADYSGQKEYSGTAQYNFEQHVTINVNYTQQIPYDEGIYTPNCCHDRGLINMSCALCDHHQRYIPVTGKIKATGTLMSRDYVDQIFTKDYKGVERFSGKQPYNGSTTYKVTEKYNQSQLTQCNADHHKCSCSNLAHLIFAAVRIMEDLSYFTSILQQQTQEIKKFSLSSNSINLKFETHSFLQDLKGFSSSTEEQIKDQIHLVLTQSKGTFYHEYHGSVPYTKQVFYSGSVKYAGTKKYEKKVIFRGRVICKGTLSDYYRESVTQSVKIMSCYDNCIFCNGYKQTQFKNVSVDISKLIVRKYMQPVNYQYEKLQSGQVTYSGTTKYSDKIIKEGKALYSDYKKVACDKDHHNCESCQKWVQIVGFLKLILEDKETIADQIQKNSQILQKNCQKILALY